MLIKAEMDSKLFDANEELKHRNMEIEELKEKNKMLLKTIELFRKERSVLIGNVIKG